MKQVHKIILVLLTVTACCGIFWIILTAGEYYLAPQVTRPRPPFSSIHKQWKPGGLIGHGLGIWGSAMMLLLLSYSVRKRVKKIRGWGRLATWLKYHIFLGILGPVLVTFHTTFKFGGLVSISFWSMIAVALSGFIGRYIYIQIPRKISGEELSIKEIETQNAEVTESLVRDFNFSKSDMEKIRSIAKSDDIRNKGVWGIFYIFYSDITGWYLMRQFKQTLAKTEKYPRDTLHKLFRLMKLKAKLSRRRAFWSGAHRLFHYWHVIHRPFAYTMLTIMIIHVVLVVTFGYTWIWN